MKSFSTSISKVWFDSNPSFSKSLLSWTGKFRSNALTFFCVNLCRRVLFTFSPDWEDESCKAEDNSTCSLILFAASAGNTTELHVPAATQVKPLWVCPTQTILVCNSSCIWADQNILVESMKVLFWYLLQSKAFTLNCLFHVTYDDS